MGSYAKVDFEIVRGDNDGMTLVWADSSGNPVDISAWTFAFEANEIDQSGTPGNIVVADAEMTKSNSGSGVTDQLDIPFSQSDTTVNEGRYRYDISATVGGSRSTVFRGTLLITPSEQD